MTEREYVERDERNRNLRVMVQEIDEQVEEMTEWEMNFIASLIDGDVFRFSPKQERMIRKIWEDYLG